jgi:predicted phosphoribosyltransferase
MYSRSIFRREPTGGRLFEDRADAARELAAALGAYRGKNPLVLAIPRGAVPMGRILADELGGELDVVLVRKLRAPLSPEFAVGAIEESGWAHIADHASSSGADEAYLREEKETQLEALRARRKMYTPARAPLDPAGRITIVVDDGLATGETMIAALHAVRSRKPSRLVCAVPVAAPDSLQRVAHYADEVVCLHAPADFQAVGQFYVSFEQVEDEDVVALLKATSKRTDRLKDGA